MKIIRIFTIVCIAYFSTESLFGLSQDDFNAMYKDLQKSLKLNMQNNPSKPGSSLRQAQSPKELFSLLNLKCKGLPFIILKMKAEPEKLLPIGLLQRILKIKFVDNFDSKNNKIRLINFTRDESEVELLPFKNGKSSITVKMGPFGGDGKFYLYSLVANKDAKRIRFQK